MNQHYKDLVSVSLLTLNATGLAPSKREASEKVLDEK